MTDTNKRCFMSHSALCRSWRIGLLAAGVGFAAVAVAAPEPVATGLNNPRGLAFGPGYGLFVAESGSGGDGPCIFNPEPPAWSIAATGRPAPSREWMSGTARTRPQAGSECSQAFPR